jgi:hypothetical protein
MRRYTHHVRCSADPSQLYRALVDIDRWPEWGGDLEWARIDSPVEPGAAFRLKPKGGPVVSMQVEAAEAPHRFVDVAHLPLARMRTVHEFASVGHETLITIVIEVFGPLGFLWDRLVARKQAADTAAQTQRLIAFAEAL